MIDSADDFVTLEDVRRAYKRMPASTHRRATFMSALNALERHSGIALSAIPLDREKIRGVLASVNPRAKGLKPKTWLNVRCGCNIAIKRLNYASAPLTDRLPIAETWLNFRDHLTSTDEKYTLSSLMRYASVAGISPQEVDDSVIARFEQSQREGLRKYSSAKFPRSRVKIWNAVRDKHPELGLTQLTLPIPSHPRKRIPWNDLPQEFRDEVEQYLYWAGGSNPFQAAARKKPLAVQTLQGQKAYLLAAADALVKTGVEVSSLRSVKDLLVPERVRTICDFRYADSNNRHTSYNFEMGRTLVQTAEWSKLPEPLLRQVREITHLQKRPPQRMTEKNKKTIRPFENPDLCHRLLRLPEVLFAEARSAKSNNRHRLAKLHAALAIAALTYFVIRLGNLASLRFGEHIDLSDGLGTLRIPREQVKNGEPLEFDIPPAFVDLLKEYREHLCPLLTGMRHARLFVNTNGTPKQAGPLRDLVKAYTKRYLGVCLNPHVFRHLAAKLILEQNPGAHVLVQHLLGHKNLATTATFYAGVETKRAGRHHLELLQRHMYPSTPTDPKGSRPPKVSHA